MKIYKTINRQPEINIFNIEKINLSFNGNILYMTSSDNDNIFIITDSDIFYIIKKKKIISELKLCSSSKKNKKNCLEKKESQIWCDKFGNHIIINHKNFTYYYNPHLPKEKLQEINFIYNNKYILPYSIAFNNDFYEIFNTGDILLSDFNSNIYKLRIKYDKNKLSSSLFLIFSLRPNKIINSNEEEDDEEEEEDEFDDLELFKLNKDEKIIDMKIIFSFEKSSIGYTSSDDGEGKNILILAMTKNSLFQFYGKGSFEKVFQNYSLENGDILKAYKCFHSNKRFYLNKSRIQLLNQYLPFYNFENFKKQELLFSCMFHFGYCIGNLGQLLNPIPLKQFIIYNYPKPDKNYLFPIMACQTIIHIFYLYDDCLVIQSKLTYRIVDIIYLKEKFLDISYNQIMNIIILYSPTNIYQISLNLEHRYLWKFYIEIGKYKYALQTLTNEDKYMKPKLRKFYANSLFEHEKYSEAALEYAFSDEIFEYVNLKFLSIHNTECLLKYLTIIFYYKACKRYRRSIRKWSIKKEKNYIEKYLLNTWIFELLIILKEKYKNEDIIPFIRNYTRDFIHGKDYIDKNIIYFILNHYCKFNDLLEFAEINQDYEFVILLLINYEKIKEISEYFKDNAYLGIENMDNNLKNIFYKYSYLLINKCPNEIFDLLDSYFKPNHNLNQIIKILLSSNYKNNEDLEKIINYIIKLIKNISKLDDNSKEKNLIEIKNLHNLFILFSSLKNKDNQKQLINFLKNLVINKPQKIYIDLNFSKFILKNNSVALSLIYYLFNEYKKCVDYSLDNNLNHILKFILKNTKNKSIKIHILQNIIKYQKRNNKFKVKQLSKDNEYTLIIDDFFIKVTGNLRINIFQDDQFDIFIDLLLSDQTEMNYNTIITEYKNNFYNFEKIGESKFSTVYKATIKNSNELRALKIINKELIKEHLNKEYNNDNIDNEFRLYISKIKEFNEQNSNINLIKYYDYFITEKELVIVMELCDSNLKLLLNEKKDGFNPKEIYEILIQLNNIFKLMEKKDIIQENLKLENILVKYENIERTKYTLKLSDFGGINRLISFNKKLKEQNNKNKILENGQCKYENNLFCLGEIIYQLCFKNSLHNTKCINKNIGQNINSEKISLKKTGNSNLDDLISKLLIKEQTKRCTWSQYFNHPFFKNSQ